MPQYRHKKRGTIYEVLTDVASLQCSGSPEMELYFEEDYFTIYKSVDTGAMYVRPTAEFQDGRFELVQE